MISNSDAECGCVVGDGGQDLSARGQVNAQRGGNVADIWDGVYNPWEMPPDELKKVQQAGGPLSVDSTYIYGTFGDLSLGRGVAFFKGESEATPESLRQWATFWGKSDAVSTDHISDRRLVKIEWAQDMNGVYDKRMRRIDPDTKGFKKELRKCVQIINQMTGVKARPIKQNRPRDAAARRYSGRLWKNDHCAILLEEVHVGSMLERWIFTVAR